MPGFLLTPLWQSLFSAVAMQRQTNTEPVATGTARNFGHYTRVIAAVVEPL
jgi:hypothetical protein